MPRETLTKRVERVEFAVQELQKVPPRVDALEQRVGVVEGQILQLRTEMRDEFSALRREMRTLHEEGVGILRGEIADARNQVLILHEEILSRIKLLGEKFKGQRSSRKQN